VEPRGELHLGVLRPRQLRDLRVALRQGQSLGALLQVVEEIEESVFPRHDGTFAHRTAGPAASTTARSTLTTTVNLRSMGQTTSNAEM
jgi:hypothetical protein